MSDHIKQVLLSMRPGHVAGAGCSCGWHSHRESFEEHLASQSPVLPYGTGANASSGHSGSDTSEARARRDDSDGTTSERQRETLLYLRQHGTYGSTWKTLAWALSWHHGQASGALSNLHKAGHISRLTETRDRCKVYVLPEYVDGRKVEPHGRKPKGPVLTEVEQQQIAGVMETVNRYDSGEHSMHHNIVPIWRVKHLLAIIDRLTEET